MPTFNLQLSTQSRSFYSWEPDQEPLNCICFKVLYEQRATLICFTEINTKGITYIFVWLITYIVPKALWLMRLGQHDYQYRHTYILRHLHPPGFAGLTLCQHCWSYDAQMVKILPPWTTGPRELGWQSNTHEQVLTAFFSNHANGKVLKQLWVFIERIQWAKRQTGLTNVWENTRKRETEKVASNVAPP